jgi:hypothetical protein
MLNKIYWFFIILVVNFVIFVPTGPKFVSATEAPWVPETAQNKAVSIYTKGDECYLVVHHAGYDLIRGVAVKTTQKQNWLDVWNKRMPIQQWSFYSIVNERQHNFSLWGENYEEVSGPEISARCLMHLYSLPEEVQKEMREYGVLF